MDPTQRVVGYIHKASATSGVEFSYLLRNAVQESGLNPTAKAKTSSATGLYQFVEQTWLRMVKSHGEKYGLSDYADHITIGNDGVARVSDKQARKEILALRRDPEIASHMAAELTKANKTALKNVVGGKIGQTELYLAHFLGANGARNFISTMRSNPNAIAADILPTAASANASVFYDKSGQPQTVAQVYKRFAQKFDRPIRDDMGVTQIADAQTPSSYKTARLDRSLTNVPDISASSAMLPLARGSKSASAMSSPFAAMMIAQMHVDSLTDLPARSRYNGDEYGKSRSPVSILGAVG